MERSGESVPGVADDELTAIAAAEGPFLSLYMNTPQEEPNAAQLAAARWSPVRRELAEKGCGEDLLGVVDELVESAHLEGAAFGVVATTSGERFVDYYRSGLSRDVARYAEAPTITPAIAWRQEEPAHLVVLADRKGADIMAITRSEPPSDVSVEADRWPVSKSGGGGWAHWGMQRAVEETWARNARAVAEEIEKLASRLDARLVVLAGDAEAIGLLRKSLPRHVAELVRETPGSRAADSGAEATGERTARLVRSATAEDTVRAIEKFRQEKGEHDRATDGPSATLAALRQSQVDVLLVHDEAEAEMGGEAWFAAGDPRLCALSEKELSGLGHSRLQRARLVDVAVRAALLTGARIRLVPAHGGPKGGLGAVLRWSKAA